jgi:hypothetical protein
MAGQQWAEERPVNTYVDGGFIFLSSGSEGARCSDVDVLHAWRSSGLYAKSHALRNGSASIKLHTGGKAYVTVQVAAMYRSVQEVVHGAEGFGEDNSTWQQVGYWPALNAAEHLLWMHQCSHGAICLATCRSSRAQPALFSSPAPSVHAAPHACDKGTLCCSCL